MYKRYKAAILKPSSIPLYINKKLISTLYFLLLGLIYILPNLIYVVSTGGIDNSYFINIVDTIRGEEVNYKVIDNTLSGVDINNVAEIKSFSTESIQISFTPITEGMLEGDLSQVYKEISSFSDAQIKLVLTEKSVIGLFDYQGFLLDINLGTYTEFNIGDINLSNTNSEVELNNFSKLLHGIHDKYKTIIILVTIPSLIIGGLAGLALTLLIPSFVLYIFNRGFGVKFGKIYHMSIYAFTIYILASTVLFMYVTSLITLIFEIISFVYLSIAMRSYAINNKGGFRREL